MALADLRECDEGERLARIESRLEFTATKEQVAELRTEMVDRFGSINNRFGTIETAIASLWWKVPAATVTTAALIIGAVLGVLKYLGK